MVSAKEYLTHIFFEILREHFVLCVRVRCTTVEYAVKTTEVLHTTALLVSPFSAIYNDTVYSDIIT